ncbi:aminodeoxychorismate synthase, component I, partial [Candidatus Pseudothioglobus singularis]|nr:aminodeoxychorismate synthase, component I [Candidatus Pseudothioglobus singularis]
MATIEIQKVDLASFCYLNKERYPFLLESVNHNENNRYSILFAFPEENIVLRNFADFDFLSELENQCKQISDNLNLPFNGGWFVYLSYELIGQIEPTLASKLHKSRIPIAYAVKIPCAIITDHKLKKTYVVDEDNNRTRINQILSDINAIENIPDAPLDGEIS